jgi:hypothetical protein
MRILIRLLYLAVICHIVTGDCIISSGTCLASPSLDGRIILEKNLDIANNEVLCLKRAQVRDITSS